MEWFARCKFIFCKYLFWLFIKLYQWEKWNRFTIENHLVGMNDKRWEIRNQRKLRNKWRRKTLISILRESKLFNIFLIDSDINWRTFPQLFFICSKVDCFQWYHVTKYFCLYLISIVQYDNKTLKWTCLSCTKTIAEW